MNLLIGIFQVFWVQFHLATVRAAIFKNTSFSQNTFNGCISCFSCSMIQKLIRELIKLETAYFLHGRCHYLHIYSQLGTFKYFSKPALNFEKRTRPEKDSATRLGFSHQVKLNRFPWNLLETVAVKTSIYPWICSETN